MVVDVIWVRFNVLHVPETVACLLIGKFCLRQSHQMSDRDHIYFINSFSVSDQYNLHYKLVQSIFEEHQTELPPKVNRLF